jgi:hypothetical protein
MLPQGLKVFPLWLLAVIACAYVLAIGPGDYWLLGKLNVRKFTWITFPVVSLAFLWGTLFISRIFIRSGDHTGVVEFRDVVAGGVISRETELQLLFSGLNQTVETVASRCLLSPLRFQDLGAQPGNLPRSGQFASDPQGTTALRGRMPTQLTAVQGLTQWTPQLNRFTKIPRQAQVDDSGFDWDAPMNIDSAANQEALRQRVISAFGANVTAHVYRAAATVMVSNGRRIVQRAPAAQKVILCGAPEVFPATGSSMTPVGTVSAQADQREDFARLVSVREDGMFTVVSQLSPMGGHLFEDLPLLDSDDENAQLLLIAHQEADRLVIYRKLYRKAGD